MNTLMAVVSFIACMYHIIKLYCHVILFIRVVEANTFKQLQRSDL